MDASLSVIVYPDAAAAEAGAAEEIASVLRSAVTKRGCASVALAGGRTPEGCYRKLARQSEMRGYWDRISVFWGDERCVPADDPSSNYQMAKRSLLDALDVAPAGVYPMLPPGGREIENCERAATTYEQTLQRIVTERIDGVPSLDLVLLGIGNDGHTASLFPGDPCIDDARHWVRFVQAPEAYAPRYRLTLTLPLISSARVVCFLVTGSGKRAVVQEILQSIRFEQADAYARRAALRYPAARISARERLVFILDAACG